MKQSFSTSEVAQYCHVTADTIRKWAEAGRIRVFKTPGGHRRIRREDLIQFLRENEIPIHHDLSGSGVRMLVVEHEQSAVTAVRRFLDTTQASFQVELAQDPFEAGRQVAAFQPDIILVDLRLPGMDGIDLCRRIKSVPELAGTHVIVMAASGEDEALALAMQNGASAHFTKPFTPDEIRRALAKVGVEAT
ncbi:MAG: response regulator [bacterium]|nr:response regulator [bacterium]